MGFCWRGITTSKLACLSACARRPISLTCSARRYTGCLYGFYLCFFLLTILTISLRCFPQANAPLAAEFALVWDELTSFLGFPRNASKGGQGTTLQCLGIEVDILAMVARLPAKKHEKALRLINHMLTSETVSLAECDQLTGFLNSCSEVIPLGRTFLHRVYNFQVQWVKPMAKRPLSPGARKYLTWWRDDQVGSPVPMSASMRRNSAVGRPSSLAR